MRKLLIACLSIFIVLNLAACSNRNDDDILPTTNTTNTDLEDKEFVEYFISSLEMNSDSPYFGKIKQVVPSHEGTYGIYDGEYLYYGKNKTFKIGEHEQVVAFGHEFVITKNRTEHTAHIFNEVNGVNAFIDKTSFEIVGTFIHAFEDGDMINIIYSLNNSFLVNRIDKNTKQIVGPYDLCFVSDDKSMSIFTLNIDFDGNNLAVLDDDLKACLNWKWQLKFQDDSAIIETQSMNCCGNNIENIFCNIDSVFDAYVVSIPEDNEHLYGFVTLFSENQETHWTKQSNRVKLPGAYTTGDIIDVVNSSSNIIIKFSDNKYCYVNRFDMMKVDGETFVAEMFDDLNKNSDQIVGIYSEQVELDNLISSPFMKTTRTFALFADGHVYQIK